MSHTYKTITNLDTLKEFKEKLLRSDFPMFYSNLGNARVRNSQEILEDFCNSYDLDLTQGGYQFTTHTEALFSVSGKVFVEVQVSFTKRENLQFILKGDLIKDEDDDRHFLNINFIYS